MVRDQIPATCIVLYEKMSSVKCFGFQLTFFEVERKGIVAGLIGRILRSMYIIDVYLVCTCRYTGGVIWI